MSKGNTFENDLVKLLFQATAIANIADNAAASPLTNLYVALHTADPGESGDQTTSEATYTGYARVAVARTSGGWSITNNVVTNVGAITFGLCTAGTNSITHFSIGVAASAASKILYSGAVGPITGIYGYTAVTANTITTPGYSPVNDDRVSIYTVEGSASVLGAGATQGVVYFVISASGETCQLSTTSGGGAVDFTTTGAGLLQKHSVLAVATNITPSFSAGQLQITEG